jgi:D-galactose 1-dehydrogenase
LAFKIGIIGMGKIAHDQHVPVIRSSSEFKLAAVVSKRGVYPAGVPGFQTPGQLYSQLSEVDAVAICTPPSTHFDIAMEALAAGKHVLIEKPPTATTAELAHLEKEALRRRCVLFTAWHSQFNAAVEEARKRLAGRSIQSMNIVWKEDVRRWHPGQEWIWQAGGFGVFDPGINALSIVTTVLPEPIFVRSADLFFPSNRDTPIAARILFRSSGTQSSQFQAEFDWRQTGQQTWTIAVETMDGMRLQLTNGGARLEVNGKMISTEVPAEYQAIYRRFAELICRKESDVDGAALQLVADAYMLGRRIEVEPFK